MHSFPSAGTTVGRIITVLVIDDEEAHGRNLCASLEDLGYQTRMASDGRGGLELFGRSGVDLVLVDLFMPIMNGLEFIAAANSASPLTPLIVVSGSGTIFDAIKAIRLGAWDYLVKPVENNAELDLVLRRNLDRARLLVENQEQKRQLEELLSENSQKLRESEARIRQLSDNLPDSMVYQVMRETDGTMQFLHLSAGLERLNGLAAEAVRRDSALFYDQILPADRELIEPARAASEESLGIFNVNVRIRRADGELRWMNLCSAPRRLPDGRIVWDGIETDITARKLAETALQQSEERFAVMFRNSPAPTSLVRMADGTFLDVNESFERTTGFRREEVLGRTALELNIYPDPSRRTFILEQLRRHGHLHGHEQLFRSKGGQIRNHVLSLDVLVIGGEQCLLVTAVDNTERKQAEDALIKSEERLRSIFAHAPVGIFQATADRFLFVNPAMAIMFNYASPAEVVAEPAGLEAFHLYPAQWRQLVREAMAADGYVERELEECRRDGARITCCLHVRAVRDSSGATLFFEGFAEDITARKRAEASLARLATAVEQVSESILITDLQGRIVYVNPAFEQNTGYSSNEVAGRNPRLLKSSRHDREFFVQMWSALERGEVWRGHLINRRKDGSLFEEESTISPVRDAAGRIVNYIGVNRDVTREMLLETQLRESQKMEAVGRLAGGVAHDFNNILAALLMQTELITMTPDLSGVARDGLQQIHADICRAAELTRQLLLFSRRQVMQLRALDLNELVTNLAKMLQRLIREDVQLSLQLHPTPLLIRADAGMLEQVLTNLAVNARDAMPRGGELRIATRLSFLDDVEARLHPEVVPGEYVSFRVSDTGGGIPPEVLPHIFEPFFTTKEVGKGTGFGLATVFGIVKQHKGWVQVENLPDKGAAFEVFLPGGGVVTGAEASAEAKLKPSGGKETILLVEDDAAVRKLLRRFLERHGYRVLEAAQGSEALACWQESSATISLLLTDLVMPGGINGLELARRLQGDQPGLKIIYASGYSQEIAGRELPMGPGEKFLQKPFEPDLLLGIVRQMLDD